MSDTNILLIFDKYLDVFAVKTLTQVILEGSSLESVKILCGERPEEEKIFKAATGDLRMAADNKSIRLKLKPKLHGGFPYPHDRFAVTDGELWHFGATVGGGHQGQTAVSRGWDDAQAKFSKFFHIVFNELGRCSR